MEDETDSRPLKTVLAMMSTVSRDATFRTEDGRTVLVGMDPSKTLMMKATLPNPPIAEEWCVSMELLRKAVGNHSVLSISDRLHVREGNLDTSIPLLSPEPIPSFPSLGFTASAEVFGKSVKDMIKGVDSKRSFTVRFSISQEGVTIDGRSYEGYGQVLSVPADECVSLDGEASAGYGTDFIQPFFSTIPNDSVIRVDMGTDFPMQISMRTDDYEVRWLCAPMIEGD